MASYTYAQIAAMVVDWAGHALNVPIQDAESVVEDMMPTALQTVALKAASNPRTESLLRRNFTITLSNGVGTVDENILTSCWPGATVYVSGEPTIGPLMSYVPNLNDFITPTGKLDEMLGRWIFRTDDIIWWVDPGATFDITSGRSGSIIMNIASVPELPATESDTLDMPGELTSDLIALLARMLASKQMEAA